MKGKNGEMLSYLSFDEKLGILTPNYTTPDIATLVDLEESGPLVVEIPPGLMAGMILDAWQRVWQISESSDPIRARAAST
jgi:hypothetical protein